MRFFSINENKHDPIVFGLFIVVGLSSWIAVNGIFQELPLISQIAPEKLDIFSYASVAVALANVFPILYAITLSRSSLNRAKLDAFMTCIVVGVVGTSSCILLACLWDKMSWISGGYHSVAFLCLVFFAGGVDCMTSLLYYPIISRYRPVYITALNAGEALTGLLAALAALIQQGDGGEKINFGIPVYFGILAVVAVASTASFLFIYLSQRGKESLQMGFEVLDNRAQEPAISLQVLREDDDWKVSNGSGDSFEPGFGRHSADTIVCNIDPETERMESFSYKKHLIYPTCFLMFVSIVENGLLVTVPPYSLVVFPDSKILLSATVKLGFGGSALMSFAAYLARPSRQETYLLVAGTVILIMGIWIVIIATTSFAKGSIALGCITAIIIVLCKWTVDYFKTILLLDLHDSIRRPGGSRVEKVAFRWAGGAIQVGSLVGSIFFFLLDTQLRIFNNNN